MKGEGNQQDYGMRIYDPRLGRFLSVDPLTKAYPMLTPYQFSSNRPIDGIDLDGMEWIDAVLTLNECNEPVLKIVSCDYRSPIGIKYSGLTINVEFKGQHYKFTTDDPKSIFSASSTYDYNPIASYRPFVEDPKASIANGNVVSKEQAFATVVSEYGSVEMLSPSAPRRGGTSTNNTVSTKPNDQAAAANGGNPEVIKSNASTSQSTQQPTPVQLAQAKARGEDHHIAVAVVRVLSLIASYLISNKSA